uniref:RanBP2-type domain-containing protein n=1 Tax=Dunaliella tertiolecta TaxID=3047 RepID=A0A7S3QSY8_DUNTE
MDHIFSLLLNADMGDFTARLTPQDFDDLKARASRGELYHLASIEGYTEDQAHYQLIKSLCGYTHPLIEEKCAVARRAPPTFTSFEAMKSFIQNNYKLQFCSICVEGRKVFLCEQLLYTRFDLDKHNKTGDDEGPLAESGFKGHPMCHFCRTRFYDSNELYRHMEGSHEHCFICRRERPHQHVYYRHYKELEDHFRQDHFICPHPACLEARFVVFPTEHEMKRHFANEHGDELKMSRAQRREAMTIPVNLQFRNSAEEEARTAALARPGVVIGGGYNLSAPRRGGGRSGQPPTLHHSSSEGQMQAALQASNEQGPSSVMFDASDFPAVSGESGGLGGQFGRWSGIGGAGPSSVLNHEEFPELPTMSKAAKKKMRQQTPLAAQLRAANMPVRIINRSSGAGPSGGSSSSSGAAGGGSSSGAHQPPDDPFPQLTAGSSRGGSGTGARHLGGQAAVRQQDVLAAQQERRSQQQQRQRQQSSRKPLLPRTPDLDAPSGNEASSAEEEESTPLGGAAAGPSSSSRGPPDGGGRGAAALGGSAGWDGGRLASGLAPSQSPPPPASIEDEFPSLAPSSAARSRGARPPVPPPAPLHYEAAAGTSAGRQSSSSGGAGAQQWQQQQQQQQQPVVRPEDFPSLGGGPSVRPLSAGQWQQKSKKGGAKGLSSSNGNSSNRPSTAHSHAAPLPGSPRSPSANGGSCSGAGIGEAGSSAEQGGGSSVSDRLKAANKALISKIRTQLGGDGAQFSRFKAESGLFMRGELSPEQYHSSIVALGLLPVVSELAALCPGTEQRSELLRAHREYLASPAANNAGPGWVPPEAAAAMAAEAESRASWSCKRCTLVNAPEVAACEMCGANREGVIPALDAFPSLPTSSSTSSSTRAAHGSQADGQSLASPAKGSKKGKGGTKITIGLGAGNARAAAEAVTAGPSKVAWGGAGSSSNNNAALRQAAQAQRDALARPNGGRGQWAQSSANNLARQIGIMNDAWGSR